MVLTVPCDPPIRSNSVGGRYFEYPLTIALYEDIVAEVDLPSYKFIYDTGRLRFITDLDKNGAPEFWLTGDVCEPGPDDPGPRSCRGTIAIELQKGALRVWKNKPYVKQLAPNPAVDLVPFGHWTLRDEAAQRRSP